MSIPRDDHADAGHVPVLLRPTMDLLGPREGEVAVDCTVGRGGHALALGAEIGPGGVLVLNDADGENLAFARARVESGLASDRCPAIVALHGNFADVPRLLGERGIGGDVVLADLGFASTHMESPARGFAFRHEGPLDMRYDTTRSLRAGDIVNGWSERDLCELIRDFGEERAAGRIAAAIIRRRAGAPIQSTGELAAVIRSVLPPKQQGGIDPATRTFQALRICVNDELGALRSLLESIARAAGALGASRSAAGGTRQWLGPGARIGIISFHSLEDREVKSVFADIVDRGLARHLTRKPVAPDALEVAANPRSRSAKLRVIELIARHGAEQPIHSL